MRTLLGLSIRQARAERARWIIDLAELQHLCLPARSWVTLNRQTGEGEWTRIWMRTRSWTAKATPYDLAKRFRRRLRELTGIDLRMETPETGPPLQIHVGSPELQDLVKLELREAHRILERKDAKAEAREERQLELFSPPPIAEVAENYCIKKHSLRWLSRRYGMNQRLLRMILVSNKREIRSPGRRRVEDLVPKERLDAALEASDDGASLAEIARVLGCGKDGARGFLKRQGRWPSRSPECG